MKIQFKQLFIALALPAMLLTSCSDDNTTEDTSIANDTYSVLASIDDAYYLAQSEDLTEGTLSFVNNGTQLDADLGARVVKQGEYLYSLNYGTGVVTQLVPEEDGTYTTIKEIDAGLAVGTTTPRFKIADESTLMVYNVTTETVTNDAAEITDYICTLRLAAINIPDLAISNLTEFVIPQTENAKLGATTDLGFQPSRVDSPVIAGDKIYFGLFHTDIQSSPIPPFQTPKQSGLETLVFDYPSFTNGTIAETDSASGHTSGYRAPSMHVDENGDVYQVNWFISANKFDLSSGDKTVITKLTDGAYDESYEFNISESLGLTSNIGTVSWFYVGNGIGYMPIHVEDEGNYYSEDSWSLVKIDIYNKTTEVLDVPYSRLFSYQNVVIEGTNLYIAICPQNGDANIYEFNSENSTMNKGLELDGANVYIAGIY